jgi:hypothetical protein
MLNSTSTKSDRGLDRSLHMIQIGSSEDVMGLFDNLHKIYCSTIEYKGSTNALSDNLYLLLNRNKVQKSSMIRLIAPDERPMPGARTSRPLVNVTTASCTTKETKERKT